MDKTILQQYIDACDMVRDTEEDLRQLRKNRSVIEQDHVRGSNPVFPYQPKSFHIEGMRYSYYQNPDQIAKTEQILQERLELARSLKVEVDAWINTVPIRIQKIIRWKYFEHLTWDQVSARLGHTSEGGARKELERFLERSS